MRPSKVVFVSQGLENEYFSLSEDDPVRKSIQRGIDKLKEDAFCGVQIQKHLFPKEYRKYRLKNLWKLNLTDGWRLLYTIARDEVEVLAVILEWFPHKQYERKFRY